MVFEDDFSIISEKKKNVIAPNPKQPPVITIKQSGNSLEATSDLVKSAGGAVAEAGMAIVNPTLAFLTEFVKAIPSITECVSNCVKEVELTKRTEFETQRDIIKAQEKTKRTEIEEVEKTKRVFIKCQENIKKEEIALTKFIKETEKEINEQNISNKRFDEKIEIIKKSVNLLMENVHNIQSLITQLSIKDDFEKIKIQQDQINTISDQLIKLISTSLPELGTL